jgi:hypothetical protein
MPSAVEIVLGNGRRVRICPPERARATRCRAACGDWMTALALS